MSRYKMEDGTVIDTDNASQTWNESKDWNGHNNISRNTHSQWHHEILHRSRRGRYYIEFWSNYQGDLGHCEWISPQRTAAWLLLNDEDLPDDLKQYEETVSE